MCDDEFVVVDIDVGSQDFINEGYAIYRKSKLNTVGEDYELFFRSKTLASIICGYLNYEHKRIVDEKIRELWKQETLITPFDFLKAWEDKDEKAIVSRFEEYKNDKKNYDFLIKCHFGSDLLIFSNIPSEFTPQIVCNCLNIRYEPEYGASTFLMDDVIINVSKVKGDSDAL